MQGKTNNKEKAPAPRKKPVRSLQEKDPYMSRNEFKEGFYEQNAGKITPEGLYGTASGKTMFESPIVDPDTSMMMSAMKDGGSVRGQKAIQVKKKIFKGVF
jgi:hypothetical protein